MRGILTNKVWFPATFLDTFLDVGVVVTLERRMNQTVKNQLSIKLNSRANQLPFLSQDEVLPVEKQTRQTNEQTKIDSIINTLSY